MKRNPRRPPISKQNVTLADIAARTGMHRSTVSLALRDDPRIARDTRDMISRIASEMKYRPNLLARAMTGHQTRSIGILLPTVREEYFTEVFAAQEYWLRQKGYMPVLAVTHNDEEEETKALDGLLGRAVDGLCVDYCPTSPATYERIAEVARGGVPVAIQNPDKGDDDLFDRVVFSVEEKVEELILHLARKGHRRVALIHQPVDVRFPRHYVSAMKAAGQAVDPALLLAHEHSLEPVATALDWFFALSPRPTAIVAYSDDLAADLMIRLLDAGVRIPGEVALTGVNDAKLASYLQVPLTTVKVPKQELAVRQMEFLVERIENPGLPARSERFESSIVLRASTEEQGIP
jgi:LacI family transcriptional regulator